VLKAIHVAGDADLKRAAASHCPLLLDAKAPAGVYGGTGRCFDWSLLKGFSHPYPVSLAGGLDAANVAEAMRQREWFAVDVSSGVERSPGMKDAAKMQAFVEAVNRC